MIRRSAPFLVIVLILALPALEASGQLPALNDLFAFGQGDGQEPARAATERRAEPPFVATPRAVCGPGSKPEPGIQGRVPAGAATAGLHCNVSLVAHQGTSGGFKVLRYVDSSGRECAYYDTALLFPAKAYVLGSRGRRKVLRNLAIGVALGVLVFFSFTELLGVRLPDGVLDPLL